MSATVRVGWPTIWPTVNSCHGESLQSQATHENASAAPHRGFRPVSPDSLKATVEGRSVSEQSTHDTAVAGGRGRARQRPQTASVMALTSSDASTCRRKSELAG